MVHVRRAQRHLAPPQAGELVDLAADAGGALAREGFVVGGRRRVVRVGAQEVHPHEEAAVALELDLAQGLLHRGKVRLRLPAVAGEEEP